MLHRLQKTNKYIPVINVVTKGLYIYIYIYIYISVISCQRPKSMGEDYSIIEYMKDFISIKGSARCMGIVIYSFFGLYKKTQNSLSVDDNVYAPFPGVELSGKGING